MGRGSSRILFLVCGVRCRVRRDHTAIGEQEKGWHPTRAETLKHVKTSDISSCDEWAAATTTAAMVGIRKPLQELIDGSPWAKQVQAVGGTVTSDVKEGVVPRGGRGVGCISIGGGVSPTHFMLWLGFRQRTSQCKTSMRAALCLYNKNKGWVSHWEKDVTVSIVDIDA